MPGYVTHYIFGRETYGKLQNNSLKKNLYYNRAAYSLGQQGPDIFFYYLPAYLLHGHNLGHMAHSEDTNRFFAALLESRYLFSSSGDLKIAEAYLCGFLGHYVLDTYCHPFVYGRTHFHGRTKDYFARHAYLETEIDTDLLQLKLHRDRSSFHAEDTIALTFQQITVISTMLRYAYRRTYKNLRVSWYTIFMAIFSTQLGFRILYDKTGQKKVLFRLSEKIFLGYPVFSPLIANDSLLFRTDPFNMQHKNWQNPWNPAIVSDETFFDLYERAEDDYHKQLKKLYDLLHVEPQSDEDRQMTRNFLENYGNLSFHSGLDVSIPT